LYTKVHEEIRKNPDRPKKEAKKKQEVKYVDKQKSIIQTAKGKYRRDRKLTRKEKKERSDKKIANFAKSLKGKWWEGIIYVSWFRLLVMLKFSSCFMIEANSNSP